MAKHRVPVKQGGGPASDERRRLLRGGLVTGPVVMTVASRPVLGQTLCFAPSASMMSMPTSGAGRTAQVCFGLTPDQWKAIPEQWPTPYVAGTTDSNVVKSFATISTSSIALKSTVTQRRQPSGTTGTTTTQDPTTSGSSSSSSQSGTQSQDGTLYHCPVTGFGGRVFGQRTMMNVIDVTDGGTNIYSLGRYMVAALLNARSGRTPVLTETTVRNMWNDLVNRGFYEPTSNVRWGATEIVSYIRTTMG